MISSKATMGEEKLSRVEFATCYDVEMSRLVRFIMKHGATSAEAVDAAQAAFGLAWETWEGIREPRAWLRKVAVREFLRRPLAETPVEQLPDQASPLSIPDIVEFGEQEQTVLEALATLPMKQRQVMAWHYDGFGTTQIAELMKINEEAVRQNLHRARARLRILLIHAGEEGGAA